MSDNSIAFAPGNFTIWEQPLDWLQRWLRRRSARIELLNWPDHMLKDIGVSRGDIAFATSHGRELTLWRRAVLTEGGPADDPR